MACISKHVSIQEGLLEKANKEIKAKNLKGLSEFINYALRRVLYE